MLNRPKQLRQVDYELYQTIGKGSIGRVKLGREKATKKYKAIKFIPKAQALQQSHGDHLKNEAFNQYNISHPFLCKLDGVIQDNKYLLLVEDFIQGGTFANYLDQKVKINAEQSSIYAAMVVLALEYLHTKLIVFRNLKPENLMLDNQGYLVFVDFGYSKIVEDKTFTICGTPAYMAPEILLNQGYGRSVDWWALGILIYEMNAGVDPFSEEDSFNTFNNIINQKVRFPKFFDESIRSICRHLLAKNVIDRYGSLRNEEMDIKTHRYFFRVNWPTVLARKIQCPFVPQVGDGADVRYFPKYIYDSLKIEKRSNQPLSRDNDPFLNW